MDTANENIYLGEHVQTRVAQQRQRFFIEPTNFLRRLQRTYMRSSPSELAQTNNGAPGFREVSNEESSWRPEHHSANSQETDDICLCPMRGSLRRGSPRTAWRCEARIVVLQTSRGRRLQLLVARSGCFGLLRALRRRPACVGPPSALNTRRFSRIHIVRGGAQRRSIGGSIGGGTSCACARAPTGRGSGRERCWCWYSCSCGC